MGFVCLSFVLLVVDALLCVVVIGEFALLCCLLIFACWLTVIFYVAA